MNSELIINSTKDGKPKQQIIRNINPDVANSVAGAFAEKCVAMSTENYSSANVVRKSDVTEEYGGGGSSDKRIPTLSVTAGGFGALNTIAYDADGTLKAFSDNGTEYTITNNQFYAHSISEVAEHGYILASETANCAPVWAEFTVYGGVHESDKVTVKPGGR